MATPCDVFGDAFGDVRPCVQLTFLHTDFFSQVVTPWAPHGKYSRPADQLTLFQILLLFRGIQILDSSADRRVSPPRLTLFQISFRLLHCGM